MQADYYSISRSSILTTIPGKGVSCPSKPGGTGGVISSGYGAGGVGSGLSALDGNAKLEIPMGTPDLIEPLNSAQFSNAYPKFYWTPQHNSTGYGSLTGHRLEIDDSADFKSPVVISYSKSGFYELLNPLNDGDYQWRVRAEYGTGTSGWSEVRLFIVDGTGVQFGAQTPTVWVRQLKPNCTAEISDLLTAVDTSSIQYAFSTTDTMQDSFSDWATPAGIIDNAGDRSQITVYARPPLKSGTNNFIKWRATDIVGNPYSESSISNIKIDTAPPLITVLAPENGSFYSTRTPEFKWFGYDDASGISGNCSIEIYKYRSHKKEQLVYEHNGTVPFNSTSIFTFISEDEFDYGSYSYRVSISDRAGHWSSYSDDLIFHIDTVGPYVEGLEPGGNEWVGTNPSFSWSALDSFAGIDHDFIFELAGDASFNKLLYHIDGGFDDLKGIFGNTFTLGWDDQPPLGSGTYFWRVSMLGNEGLWSNYSKPMKFKVDDTLPYAVSELPLNGSWSAGKLKFRFFAHDTGSGLSGNYRIQLAEEPEFKNPVVDAELALLPVQPGAENSTVEDDPNASAKTYLEYSLDCELAEFVYFWRVSAEDNVGQWSIPTITRELLVDLRPPTVITHTPDSGDWAGNDFELKWSAQDDQSGLSGRYHVQIAQTDDFSNPVLNATIAGTADNYVLCNYDPDEVLPEGRLYWRVATEDRAGNLCPFTTPIRFNLDLKGVEFTPALNKAWYNTANVSFVVELSDAGAGIDRNNIYYRTSDSGVSTYTNWKHVPQSAINIVGKNRFFVSVFASCAEGLGNFVQIRAKDLVNDEYQESPNYRIAVDLSPVIFSDAKPSFDDWQPNPSVEIGIAILDILSGVRIDSIEYRFTSSGADDLGPWLTYNNSYQRRSTGEIVCHLRLAFKSGETNFVQWRVYDNAGNGYFESEIYQVKVGSMIEDENEKKLDPHNSGNDEAGWKWLVSADGLFLIRLLLIMVVMLILFGLLRRHSGHQYNDKQAGVKNFGRRGKNNGPPSQPRENFEDVMNALEHELKGSYSTRKSQDPDGTSDCAICRGPLDDDSTVLDCSCGKVYHVDCVSREGKCISCSKII
jgi:hypothetical protein